MLLIFKSFIFRLIYLYLIIESLIPYTTYEDFFYYMPYLENFYFDGIYPFLALFSIDVHTLVFILLLHILISYLLIIVNDICGSKYYQNNYAKCEEDGDILYLYILILFGLILYFFKVLSLKKFALYILLLAFFF